MKRAGVDLQEATKQTAREHRGAVVLPSGHTIKPLGVDMEKAQFVELQKFLILEVARMFRLPPVFLQDLTYGTYTNTEQQDLNLVKHTLRQHVKQAEGELNLKLFGRPGGNRYVKFNIDGLLRGDFASRMDGYAKAVQNSLRTPDECRELDNLPRRGGPSDQQYIQGATVPLGTVPANSAGNSTGDNANAGNRQLLHLALADVDGRLFAGGDVHLGLGAGGATLVQNRLGDFVV